MKNFLALIQKWIWPATVISVLFFLQTFHLLEVASINPNLSLCFLFLVSFSRNITKSLNFVIPAALAIIGLSIIWVPFSIFRFLLIIIIAFAFGFLGSFFDNFLLIIPITSIFMTFLFYFLTSFPTLPEFYMVLLESIYNFLFIITGYLLLRRYNFYLKLK